MNQNRSKWKMRGRRSNQRWLPLDRGAEEMRSFPVGICCDSDGKESAAMQETGFDPWIGKIPWRREWLPLLAFVPREFNRQRSLAEYCPWGLNESDTTEWLSLLVSLLESEEKGFSDGLEIEWWETEKNNRRPLDFWLLQLCRCRWHLLNWERQEP